MKHNQAAILKIDNPKTLGALIRATRTGVGLTQAQAAALVGVGVRFLSELERGKESVSFHLVLRVLERFGLEVAIAPRGVIPLTLTFEPEKTKLDRRPSARRPRKS